MHVFFSHKLLYLYGDLIETYEKGEKGAHKMMGMGPEGNKVLFFVTPPLPYFKPSTTKITFY